MAIMKAWEVLAELGTEHCPECRCAVSDDTAYKDFSNKNIIICAQCSYEWNLDKG